jgi:glycerol uptake facilitator-like aquaporin
MLHLFASLITQEYFAEFVGTAFLVYVILATGHHLANGAALAIAIFLTAGICKQSFNPAVSVALVHYGKLPAASLVPYIIAETLGALFAVLVLSEVRKPGKWL